MNGRSTEEYLLLVHRDGPIKEIGDLQGRSLVWLEHPRACLAPVWLDTLLAQGGLGPADQFFGKMTPTKKASQAVLSVFFRQADVSLTTRNGFQMAAELNPQVGQQLRVLASSPEFVHHVYRFRPDYPADNLKQVLAAMSTMHQTPSGQQMQTVFKVDRLEEAVPHLSGQRPRIAGHTRAALRRNEQGQHHPTELFAKHRSR